MVRVFIGVGIVALALLIYALADCFQTPRHRVRVMPKVAWIFVILLVPLLGAGLWLAFGRLKQPKKRPDTGPTAPDDDPEFLRQVEIRRRQMQRREEEERQRELEARKEAEARRRAARGNAAQSETSDNDADQAPPATGPQNRSPESPEDPEDNPGEGPAPSR